MAALAERLDAGVKATTNFMIAIHGLDGSTETILKRVQESYSTQEPIPEGRAALFGGVLTGALSGLKADLATGGLSMGAGMLIGAVLGGLGGAGLARGINKLTGTEQARLRWPDDFLDGLIRASVLRYLASRALRARSRAVCRGRGAGVLAPGGHRRTRAAHPGTAPHLERSSQQRGRCGGACVANRAADRDHHRAEAPLR